MVKTFVVLAFFAVPSALAEPEFIGFLSSNQSGTQFAVSPEPGASPRWVKLGDRVGEYLVSAFRAEDEALVLKKDGREFSVKLKSSKVQSTGFRGSPMSFASAKELIANDPEWQAEVRYRVSQQPDGNWLLVASRQAGSGIRMRLLPLIPESIPAEEKKPNKEPEPARGKSS